QPIARTNHWWSRGEPAGLRPAANLAHIRHPGQGHAAFALEGALQRLAGKLIGEIGAIRFRQVKAEYPIDDPTGDAPELPQSEIPARMGANAIDDPSIAIRQHLFDHQRVAQRFTSLV